MAYIKEDAYPRSMLWLESAYAGDDVKGFEDGAGIMGWSSKEGNRAVPLTLIGGQEKQLGGGDVQSLCHSIHHPGQ